MDKIASVEGVCPIKPAISGPNYGEDRLRTGKSLSTVFAK
jgi:hypothetical protein